MAARHSPFPRLQRRKSANAGSGWLPVDLGGHQVVSRPRLPLRRGPQVAGEGRHALDRLEGTVSTRQLGELRLLVTELLTNSVKHAGSAEDWIMLDVGIYPKAVRVVVTDRGPGFDPPANPEPHPDRRG